jgi:methionine-rich copper-binding protein CopC
MLFKTSWALAGALGAAAAPMSCAPAFAHAHLQKAVPPADGAVAASPAEIRLKFSEGVEPRFSGIALTTQAGAIEPTGQPSVDPSDNSVLIATVGQKLEPGVYKVTWHAVSADTHRTQGSFTFTVAP